MLLNDAMLYSLQRYDSAAGALRRLVVDFEHLSLDSIEMKEARQELLWAMEEIQKIKLVWQTAKAYQKRKWEELEREKRKTT